MDRDDFLTAFAEATSFSANRFHPLVWILVGSVGSVHCRNTEPRLLSTRRIHLQR